MIELEHVTVAEGMARLFEEYQKICEETGEKPLALVWEVEGVSRVIPRLNLKGSFLSSCQKLAFFARMTCRIEGNRVMFSEVSDGPVATRAWTVPPTFMSRIAELLNEDPKMLEGEAYEDPLDLSEVLGEIGIWSEGEDLKFDPGSGRFVVTTGSGNLALLEAFIKMTAEDQPRQIRYEVTHLVDGKVVSLPSLVTLPGSSSTIEMGQEFLQVSDEEVVEAMVGVTFQVEGELYGLGDRSKVSYSQVDDPSARELQAFEASGRLDDLDLEETRIDEQTIVTRGDQRFDGGVTEFFRQGEEVKLPQITITSQRIDATGRPVFEEDPKE